MTRAEHIEKAAHDQGYNAFGDERFVVFVEGAKWADSNQNIDHIATKEITDLESKLASAIQCLEYCYTKFGSKKAKECIEKIKGST